LEGVSAKGLFDTRGQARNFRYRKKPPMDALARFAEQLSLHIDEDDIEAGEILATGEPLLPNQKPDPGGNVRESARRIGLKPQSGNGLLQRIRRSLGDQAR
jgi:hypothetical protein